MLNPERKFKIDTPEEIETVRCIVKNNQGQILLLQKVSESKAPDLFEFPGGKIDKIVGTSSTLQEQLQAIVNEMFEETGLDISARDLQKADEFSYQFNVGNNLFSRRVHMFLLLLQTNGSEVSINRTINFEGQPEDKHKQFAWVTKSDLLIFKANRRLSGNSQQFERTLGTKG